MSLTSRHLQPTRSRAYLEADAIAALAGVVDGDIVVSVWRTGSSAVVWFRTTQKFAVGRTYPPRRLSDVALATESRAQSAANRLMAEYGRSRGDVTLRVQDGVCTFQTLGPELVDKTWLEHMLATYPELRQAA